MREKGKVAALKNFVTFFSYGMHTLPLTFISIFDYNFFPSMYIDREAIHKKREREKVRNEHQQVEERDRDIVSRKRGLSCAPAGNAFIYVQMK
jgi:hypothetical protein